MFDNDEEYYHHLNNYPLSKHILYEDDTLHNLRLPKNIFKYKGKSNGDYRIVAVSPSHNPKRYVNCVFQ